jgi:hypothetical protein
MFGFSTRTSNDRTPMAGRRLRLEALEDRCVPATITLDPVVYGIGRHVTISGTLTGTDTPAWQSIQIWGNVAAGTQTDAAGKFQVPAHATALGEFTVAAPLLPGTPVTGSLTDVAPVLVSLNAIEASGDPPIFEFSGQTSYGRPTQVLTVVFWSTLASHPNFTTVTDGQNPGNYIVFKTLNGTQSDEGTVYAKVVSPWGTESNVRSVNVHQSITGGPN